MSDLVTARERIATLESAIRRMHASIPGGSICDPQQIADTLREVAAEVGVDVDALSLQKLADFR